MGVIILLLLGGFAQKELGFAQMNLGALVAGQDLACAVMPQDGFTATIQVLELRDRYEWFTTVLKPQIGIRKGLFSCSIGYLLSPFSAGNITGVPFCADISANIKPINHLFIRPRVALLGPATFYAADPYQSYATSFTAGGGADIIYDPFSSWRIRPVFSLGASAGYALGNLVSDIPPHQEPLEGFGAAGDAILAFLYNQDSWSIALQTGASYGGRLVPQVSFSFLW
jgi:hypothetical protein